MSHRFTMTALAFALFACSSEPASPTNDEVIANAPTSATANESVTAEPAKSGPATVLALEGLGDLVIGKPVASGSSWAERGAQTSDQCRTLSSPAYPGVYAIVEGGAGRR